MSAQSRPPLKNLLFISEKAHANVPKLTSNSSPSLWSPLKNPILMLALKYDADSQKFSDITSAQRMNAAANTPLTVNEIAWNMKGEMFFLTIGNGTVEVLSYPSLRPLDSLMAHTAVRDHNAMGRLSLTDVGEVMLERVKSRMKLVHLNTIEEGRLVANFSLSSGQTIETNRG
ncbi:hypothetical protein JHK82_031470 [Glycine max]|nr:hypothetical protein JHK86_031560 [Glycine max]KAG5124733.1 hypothetical protein JHK82_031470 [Glycine max]